jgi:hypothetical protein
MAEKTITYRISIGTPEGTTLLAKLRCEWEDNIKMDLTEKGWGVEWIKLATLETSVSLLRKR